MRYLTSLEVTKIERDWQELGNVIEAGVAVLDSGDFSQPIKPYLRYRDHANRIIAMPAFAGGSINVAGIKWIASFPGNVKKGLSRAQSITVLNESNTGVPFCIINSSLISCIRTAAVSALVLERYLSCKNPGQNYKVGITGFGPIARMHIEMIVSLIGSRLIEIAVYDIEDIDLELLPEKIREKTVKCESYMDAFSDADIFITATVAKAPYINIKPKPGSIHLNISLRDYCSEFLRYVNVMIVDNWEEVCRENTDIENMSINGGLRKEQTLDIIEFINKYNGKMTLKDEVLMFNPMGMGIFDLAIALYYYDQSILNGIGIELPE
jgi:2,3-diaminopropionate biosynthesis protein SbnB